MVSSSDESIRLCVEYSEYFTNSGKEGKTFVNVWSSFMWSLLINKDILEIYRKYIWRFIPHKWIYWWLDHVQDIDNHIGVTLYEPLPIFKDISDDIQDMNRSLEINSFSELRKCCNQHLMPLVLCPWESLSISINVE